MPLILDGRRASKELKERIKNNILKMPSPPILAILTDEIESPYIKMVEKAGEETGISCRKLFLSKPVKERELLDLLDRLNGEREICGIFIDFNLRRINNLRHRISPFKDIGCISPMNIGRFIAGNPLFYPSLPFGILKLLEYYGIDVKGLDTVIIGRSERVGKPIGIGLLNHNATVTICHTKSRNLEDKIRRAQLLISAAGKANLIRGDMIREGAIVVDVGINRLENGRVVGDVDYESVKSKVYAITPVPGGVGPMNTAMLFYNTMLAAGGKKEL